MLPLAAIAEFFSFDQYMQLGIDAAIYFMLAMTATLFFLIYLGLQLIGIGGGDLHVGDVHVGDVGDAGGHGAGHVDSTGAFTVFSLLSILAFFMGTGWMGLTARVSWEMAPAPAAFAATGFGVGLMLLSAGLMYAVRKMSREAHYEMKTAVGKTGRVYLTIPPKGKGHGQVEVNVSGRRKIVPAASSAGEIAAFTAVTIVGIEDDQSVVVEVKG
jgi:hypothetical protein